MVDFVLVSAVMSAVYGKWRMGQVYMSVVSVLHIPAFR